MARVIKRGQVWITDLNPGHGLEIHKKRPVLIISSDFYNKYLPSVVVLPISSQMALQGPEAVRILARDAGIHKNSILLTAGIRAIDKVRLIEKTGSVSKEKLIEIEDALKVILGFEKQGL